MLDHQQIHLNFQETMLDRQFGYQTTLEANDSQQESLCRKFEPSNHPFDQSTPDNDASRLSDDSTTSPIALPSPIPGFEPTRFWLRRTIRPNLHARIHRMASGPMGNAIDPQSFNMNPVQNPPTGIPIHIRSAHRTDFGINLNQDFNAGVSSTESSPSDRPTHEWVIEQGGNIGSTPLYNIRNLTTSTLLGSRPAAPGEHVIDQGLDAHERFVRGPHEIRESRNTWHAQGFTEFNNPTPTTNPRPARTYAQARDPTAFQARPSFYPQSSADAFGVRSQSQHPTEPIPEPGPFSSPHTSEYPRNIDSLPVPPPLETRSENSSGQRFIYSFSGEKRLRSVEEDITTSSHSSGTRVWANFESHGNTEGEPTSRGAGGDTSTVESMQGEVAVEMRDDAPDLESTNAPETSLSRASASVDSSHEGTAIDNGELWDPIARHNQTATHLRDESNHTLEVGEVLATNTKAKEIHEAKHEESVTLYGENTFYNIDGPDLSSGPAWDNEGRDETKLEDNLDTISSNPVPLSLVKEPPAGDEDEDNTAKDLSSDTNDTSSSSHTEKPLPLFERQAVISNDEMGSSITRITQSRNFE
ncbi:hypothetical protein ABKN59_011397 [Abortiporus biennis]